MAVFVMTSGIDTVLPREVCIWMDQGSGPVTMPTHSAVPAFGSSFWGAPLPAVRKTTMSVDGIIHWAPCLTLKTAHCVLRG